MSNKKIVVIGGGHGQATICRALKRIDDIDITAIVTVADDGGSTGRLRRQFHIPAMGDIRNVMISLANDENLMTKLMNYRFEDPDNTERDIAGHNLGNIILTAMTQETGSFFEAVKIMCSVLNVRGCIIPASTQVISLYALMEDGVIIKGEANIPNYGNRIKKVYYDDKVKATPDAVKAIEEADIIIYGIGSIYTSILPNVIIEEIREALNKSHAKKIYFCNAMTQSGETDRYSMEDHVSALESHGAHVDGVVVANDEIPEEILERYRVENSDPVLIKEIGHNYRVYQRSLLSFDKKLIRHDISRISSVIEEIIKE